MGVVIKNTDHDQGREYIPKQAERRSLQVETDNALIWDMPWVSAVPS